MLVPAVRLSAEVPLRASVPPVMDEPMEPFEPAVSATVAARMTPGLAGLSLLMFWADARLTLPLAPASMLPTSRFLLLAVKPKSRLVELAMSVRWMPRPSSVSVKAVRLGAVMPYTPLAVPLRVTFNRVRPVRLSTAMLPPLVRLTSGACSVSAAPAAPIAPPAVRAMLLARITVAASPSSSSEPPLLASVAAPPALRLPMVVVPEDWV